MGAPRRRSPSSSSPPAYPGSPPPRARSGFFLQCAGSMAGALQRRWGRRCRWVLWSLLGAAPLCRCGSRPPRRRPAAAHPWRPPARAVAGPPRAAFYLMPWWRHLRGRKSVAWFGCRGRATLWLANRRPSIMHARCPFSSPPCATFLNPPAATPPLYSCMPGPMTPASIGRLRSCARRNCAQRMRCPMPLQSPQRTAAIPLPLKPASTPGASNGWARAHRPRHSPLFMGDPHLSKGPGLQARSVGGEGQARCPPLCPSRGGGGWS